jgi:hypothetical protein
LFKAVRLAATVIAALSLTAQAAVITLPKPENFTPEPAALGLIGAGLMAVGLLRRRTRRH